MIRASLTVICLALLLSCACWAKPNGSKNKKPKQVVPDIECDVRAGKINLPEFIVKCPAHCKETKQQVYGTGVFASISSICNAAIHSGVITNTGGKVIVRKMAGQNLYKGSNSNGVRSLSLPKWRESFVVSVGKPKKGVIYPSTLDYVPSRPTYVKTSQKEAKLPAVTTSGMQAAVTHTLPLWQLQVQDSHRMLKERFPAKYSEELPIPIDSHNVPVQLSHPLGPRSAQTRRGSAIRRQPSSPVGPAFNRVQPAPPERTPTMSQSNPGKSLQTLSGSSRNAPSDTLTDIKNQELFKACREEERDESSSIQWPGASPRETHEPIHSAAGSGSSLQPLFPEGIGHLPPFLVLIGSLQLDDQQPTLCVTIVVADTSTFSAVHSDVSYAAPDSGYTWSETDRPEITARDHRPDISEYERWFYNFGPYQPRTPESDGNRRVPLDTTHTRVEPVDAWKPDANPYESGFNVREQEPVPRAPEPVPVSQGDPDCKVDLVFLMDGSWSIGKRRFKIQKDFLSEVAQTINVGVAGPMMGLIQYGDDPVTEISLKSYSNSREVKSAIEKIGQKGGLSNVGKALSYINKHFFSDANGNRGGAPNVAVVLVDGWPTDKVEEASRLARESGINIFFVTIEGADDNEKQNLVETNFVDKVDWFALRKAVQPLVKRVCDTDRLLCSKTCLNANDIAFVIDGSSSVGTGNFRTVLQFVANITREFEISDTDTRVGAVQYTYEQRLEFGFGQYNNKAELLNAIKRVNYWSGGTSTGAAITFAADQLFSKSKPNKRKIMIVITDGRSYDDVRAPSLAVHSQGVIAYSIGIAWAAHDELEYIATDPDKEHSFFVDEFDNLYKFVPKIINNICQEFNSQPRN
ncbi:Vitrin [Dissostichus eleginoides]|uniref:Cochlin n=1 Tax=Dissostichus eleginoides TaxID=100907 RepID=A0AAD9CPJ8_DISEL|nr:Vitrin [Dissostichus eleginoides]